MPSLLIMQAVLRCRGVSFERCVVLVADGEPSILLLATNALRRHGYIVIPASNGPSALRACQEREGPAPALLDVAMPGMSVA
jgi:CheY-like chemotaxis protein